MKLVTVASKEEAKERLVQGAFIGWQLGAAGKRTFQEYLHSLGLLDESQVGLRRGVEDNRKLERMGIRKAS